MGTNIFLIPRIDPAKKYALMKAVVEEDWETLEELIPQKVHIGKFSAGWMFLFNYNKGKYYAKNRAAVEEFFATGKLQDEYGKDLTDAEFWDKVAKFQEGMWEKTAPTKWWPEPTGKVEEIIDGLRWSAWDEFS